MASRGDRLSHSESFVSFETEIAAPCTGLVGVGFLARAFYEWNRMSATADWRRTIATVMAASVVSQTDSEGGKSYSISVRYEFAVDGARHTGIRIGFSARSYVRKKGAEAELAHYPANSTLPVWFDPRKPAEAVLIRKYPYTPLYFGMGIVLAGLALLILLYPAK